MENQSEINNKHSISSNQLWKQVSRFNILFLVYILFFILSPNNCLAQVKGEPIPPVQLPDSNYVFKSPRPLQIESGMNSSNLKNSWGFDMLFSESGFGLGMFMQRRFNASFSGFMSLYISGARNSDEIEYYNYITGETVIPGKINRLYIAPLMLGLQYDIFKKGISQNFSPYIQLGFGPTFILSTPFSIEFFKAFSYSSSYTRFGGFFGIGSTFGGYGNTVIAGNIRYYIIPFGGDGLQSIIDKPITTFGGIFLSLSIGMKY